MNALRKKSTQHPIEALQLQILNDPTSAEEVAPILIDAYHETGRVADAYALTWILTNADTDNERRAALARHHGRDDVAMMLLDELPTRAKTRKRVEKLTSAESAKMAAHAAHWVKIGLSTERADRPLFEAAVACIYRNLDEKLARPQFAWCKDPLETVSAGALRCADSQVDSQVHSQVGLQVGSQVRSQVHSQVHSQVDSQVHSQVGLQVDSQVHSQVGSQVGSQVDSQVHSQVGLQVDSQVHSQVHSQVGSQVDSQVHSQVGSQVGSQVDSQVHSQVGSQVGSQVHSQAVQDNWSSYLGGQFWVGDYYFGPAGASFALDVLRLDIGTLLETRSRAYWQSASSACWWYPTTTTVFACERPRIIDVRDGKLRLAAWDGWEVRS